MLGLLFLMLMMDTAMQETPPTYYVRRQMPVAEPEKPVEPVEPVEPEFEEAFEEVFDDEPQETPEPAEDFEETFEEEFDDKPVEPEEPEEPEETVFGKWIDVFHVNHEKAVWVLRFEEYWDHIDEFHVFESSVSHRGNGKKMLFSESGLDTSKYADKIHYHTIPPAQNRELCKKKDEWECETHDRRFIGSTMLDLIRPDDVIVFSDADEILSSRTLQSLHVDRSLLPVKINTPAYKYSFHWAEDEKWAQATVLSGQTALDIPDWNDLRRKNNFKVYPDGGWHISTFGSIDDIMQKGKMSIHERIFSKEETERRVRSGIAMYDSTKQFSYVEYVLPRPKLAMSQPDYFEDQFMRYGKTHS